MHKKTRVPDLLTAALGFTLAVLGGILLVGSVIHGHFTAVGVSAGLIFAGAATGQVFFSWARREADD